MSIDTIEKPPIEQPVQQIADTKPETAEKLVIFAWSGELDKLWPTMILATTGAAMGKETTVFFTFWGLFPLVKNEIRLTGENWMQKMLSVMNRGGIDHLKLSKMNFAGMGPAMMKKLPRSTRSHRRASCSVACDLGVLCSSGHRSHALRHGVAEAIGGSVAPAFNRSSGAGRPSA